MAQFIDISLPFRPGMITWPGDEEFRLERVLELGRGGSFNLSRISMGLHAGTHLDAPLHFLPGGMDISSMPPAVGVGPCRVVEIPDRPHIDREDLEPLHPQEGERMLFKTRNSLSAWWERPFDPRYACLTVEAARYLAERGVILVGIDYLSVAPFEEREAGEVHRLLLEAGVWILEGLNLRGVEPGDYELFCLPLKVENGDGAPARAILSPLL